MKHLSTISIALLVLMATACGNSSAGTTDSSAAGSASTSSATPGNASFSANINGDAVSGGIIDDQQQINSAYIVQSDASDETLFFLNDTKSKETTQDGKYSMRFAIPHKSGTIHIGPDEETWGVAIDVSNNKTFAVQYHSDDITINITTLSATRVAGTFSCRFKVAGDTPLAKAGKFKNPIEIKDGKFDIPFSTGHLVPM